MKPTFICIGDITSDAFITLQDASVHCDISGENCTISMRWGDKIPYKDATVIAGVGNSPNAAVAAARLGLPVGLVTFFGNDAHGRECLDVLKKENIATEYVSIQDNKKSNYHYVLSYDAERTILVRHEQFDYSLPELPAETQWLYFSSVGVAGEPLHSEVVQWLDKNPATKMLFQPGTFQIQLGYERLKEVYKRTHLFVCNKEEAQKILNTEEKDIKTLLSMMCAKGPTIVSITDGPKGAYIYDGTTTLYVPQYPDRAPPKERTGAGDAYTSTLAVHLAKGFSLKESLLRAPINSMSVVQHIGAQAGLLREEALQKYLKEAPGEYKVSEI